MTLKDQRINKFEIVILLIVFLVGFVIRCKYFQYNNIWTGDVGRDMLVGYFESQEGKSSELGHYNSGLGGNYPDIYYSVHGIINKLGNDNIQNIFVFIIAYQSSAVIFLYLLLKTNFSGFTSLFLSFVYATNALTLYYTFYPISAFQVIPLLIISALIFQYAKKYNSGIVFLLSSVFFSISISFFYGAILVLPLAIISLFMQYNKSILKKVQNFLYFFLSFLISYEVVFFKVQKTQNIQQLFKAIKPSSIQSFLVSTPELITEVLQLVSSFFTMLSPLFPSFTFILYFSSFLLLVINKKTRKSTVFFSLWLLTIFSLYAILSFKLSHYIQFFYLFLLFPLALTVETIRKDTRLSTLFIMCFIFATQGIISLKTKSEYPSFEHYRQVNQKLAEYYQQYSVIFTKECDSNLNFKWESRAFWYFQRNQPYYLFDSDHSQVEMINPKKIFICSGYLSESVKLSTYVLNQFTVNNSTYTVYKIIQ